MEYQKTIVLHAIQDGLLEGDESYTIQLVATDDTEISPISGKNTTFFSICNMSKA